MSSALSVAKELVRLSLAGEEPDPLTHLRLQKLLYYAQGWSLIVRESELFPDEIEAWRWGPVVPNVYRAIPVEGAVPMVTHIFQDCPDLGEEEAEFVKRLWEAYAQFSALQLSRMTHQELPWRVARGDLPPESRADTPIAIDDLEAFFGTQSMPAPLATHLHDLRKRDEDASRELASIPPLDVSRLTAASRSVTPAARQVLDGI